MGKDAGKDDASPTMKPKTDGFRQTAKRLREKETRLSNRAALDWRMDHSRVCEMNGSAAEVVPVESLLETLKKSRTGESLIADANPATLSIIYDRQSPASQFYVRGEQRIITLNPYRMTGDLLNLLVRELRRAGQHKNGALVNPLSFEPDEAILVNRAQQADVLMVSVKVAWELRLAGESEAWDFISATPLADVSRIFELKAQTDFRTLNNGEASRAAYDKFFEDSRTKLHDKRIIHQMLLDEHGYMKAGMKRPKVGMELFKKLGEMPNGRNYLSMKSQRQPTDLCYATVEDRSNANFLWFIKFERSFQEKELQMVQESVKLSAEVVDFKKWPGRAKRTPQPERSH
ncbi:MAG TPA: DUF6782 family putative metallopeptidase [Patescibacteria group bacterium]|nr:DUF6782 family putative metallopeptidase [Patescibacteria group bacterium]